MSDSALLLTIKQKLCVNCASFGGLVADIPLTEGLTLGKYVCTDRRNSFLDLVAGEKRQPYDCSWLRNLDLPETCGRQAKWWKSK